jgi:hypothetical protein
MKANENIEPLPCPFCGEIPDVREAINQIGAWGVFCINFGNDQSKESGCDIMPRTAWYLSSDNQNGKSTAITLWNKRQTK